MYYLQKSLFKFSQIYYNRTSSLKTKLTCFGEFLTNQLRKNRKEKVFVLRTHVYVFSLFLYISFLRKLFYE